MSEWTPAPAGTEPTYQIWPKFAPPLRQNSRFRTIRKESRNSGLVFVAVDNHMGFVNHFSWQTNCLERNVQGQEAPNLDDGPHPQGKLLSRWRWPRKG